jgi:hypothetical protein
MNRFSHNSPPLKVLLAEDSPVNQRIATILLEAGGHEVTLVENGQQAVDALESRSFDVVLMDIEMPEMDGLSATRVIRGREKIRGGHVPIVAVTSNDNRHECLNAGMDAYLSKADLAKQLNLTLVRLRPDAA